MPTPQRFGPYEVVASLGAGGMGEVYRARDARLQRDVAIKVLLHASPDPTREQRLLDEATKASALNHPNIITVYDVGRDEGSAYIVSEFVDGSSLRAVIARAPLQMRELLGLAVQMADGLAAAHRAGIVHCDFKPANVMVTREGRAKILDFGLARTARQSSGTTEDSTVTLANMMAGTVQYMSPEQARGALIDFRSDQFSFGLTLFEMATGKRPFVAETAPQILAAIIEDDPPSISTLNPRVPAPLRWVIERCLAKDPRQRYEATSDLASDLHTIRDRLPEIAAADALPGAARRWRRVAWYGLGAALILTTAVFTWPLTARPVPNLANLKVTPIATDAGYQDTPVWSPDGSTLAYVADQDGVLQIFTKRIGSPARQQVTHGLFDATDPFWSPDGTRIYFIAQAGLSPGLWWVSEVGGEPESVHENVVSAALSPDGKTLAMFRSTNLPSRTTVQTLWFSSPPSADPTEYKKSPFDRSVDYAGGVLHFSPDSTKLGVWNDLWAATGLATYTYSAEFWIVPMHSGTAYRDTGMPDQPSAARFTWFNDGRRIVEALRDDGQVSTHLWIGAVGSGERRRILLTTDNEDAPAVSPDSTKIAFTLQQANYNIVSLPLRDRSMAATPVTPHIATALNEMSPTYSEASNQLAYVTDRNGHQEIWLHNESDGRDTRLVTPDDFTDTTFLFDGPQFSHKGQYVAFYRFGRQAHAVARIWIKPVDGSPPQRLEDVASGFQNTPTWSPGDDEIAYASSTGGDWALVKKRVGANTPHDTITTDVQSFSIARWSPDGRWIAFKSSKGLSIVTPDGNTTRSLQDENDERVWLEFTWWPDGSPNSTRLIGVRTSDDRKHLTLSSIDIETSKEQVLADRFLPRPISPRPVLGLTVMGKSVLMSVPHIRSAIWMLEGFDDAPSLWHRLWSRNP